MPLLDECQFHGVFGFKYSPRPNTPALGMIDSISEEEKSKRLQILQERQREIQRINYDNQLGRTIEVMVEGKNETRGHAIERPSHNATLNFTTGDSSAPEVGTYDNVLVILSSPIS